MRHIQPTQLLEAEELVEAPVQRACSDQTFELPSGIYAAMGLMFGGFVVILSFAFRDSMSVSFGMIFAFLAVFFAVPALFPGMANGARALRWDDFVARGIDTATGRTSALSATVLVLVLPFLILCFAIAVTIIAALV